MADEGEHFHANPDGGMSAGPAPVEAAPETEQPKTVDQEAERAPETASAEPKEVEAGEEAEEGEKAEEGEESGKEEASPEKEEGEEKEPEE